MNTEKIIKQAAYELFEEKPFDQLTVEDILQKAEVSRRTFYKYFHDKYELMYSYYTDTVAESLPSDYHSDQAPTEEVWVQFATAFLKLMKERKAYFNNNKDDYSPESLWNFMMRYSVDISRKLILQKGEITELSPKDELVLEAATAGLMYILKSYMYDDTNLSIEDLLDVIKNIFPNRYRCFTSNDSKDLQTVNTFPSREKLS